MCSAPCKVTSRYCIDSLKKKHKKRITSPFRKLIMCCKTTAIGWPRYYSSLLIMPTKKVKLVYKLLVSAPLLNLKLPDCNCGQVKV